MKCPECGDAILVPIVVPLFWTMFEGVEIVVPNAKFRECPRCGGRCYHARELRRWREIKRGNYLGDVN